MKRIYLLISMVLLIATLSVHTVFAQNYTQWRLPDGAKARFGKGWINDIKFSPLGHQVSVATTIGVWIYDVLSGEAVNLFTGNMGGANAIAYSPDGRTLAAAHWDRTVGLWDVNAYFSTRPSFTFPAHDGPIYAVAISPDNRMVASGGADKLSRGGTQPTGLIKVWDTQMRNQLRILPYNTPVSTLAFSPNSRWIAGGSGDGTIRVWDAGTGDRIHEFNDHKESVSKVDFSPDSRWLLSVSLDGTGFLRYLVPPYQEPIPLTKRDTASPIYAASFSPAEENDRYNFATGSGDERIQLLEMQANNRKELVSDNFSLAGHNDSVWILAFSKDGQNLASGSLDGTVRLWDTYLRLERLKLTGHTGGIKALAYREDNSILACGTGLDGMLRLWDAGRSGQLSILLDHAGVNKAVTFSNKGKTLASGGSENQTILLSDVNKVLNDGLNNSLLYSLIGNEHGVTALALASPASGSVPRIASGGKDARIHIFVNRIKQEPLTGAESPITALIFSPDNSILVSGEENGTVRVWNALSGMQQFDFKTSFYAITALAFSPYYARFLAIGDEIGKIRLFDMVKQNERYIFTQHTRKITTLVFSEDGRTLVSGSEDGTILLWDMNEAGLE